MYVLNFGVIPRCRDLQWCKLSHAMSSGFCLKFVSFFTATRHGAVQRCRSRLFIGQDDTSDDTKV